MNENFALLLSNPINAALDQPGRVGLIGDDDTKHPAGEPITLVQVGDPVPDEPGRVFTDILLPLLSGPSINIFNEVAFVAVTDDSTGTNSETGVWVAGPGYLYKAASRDTAVGAGIPPGTEIIGDFRNPVIDDEGRVYFKEQFKMKSCMAPTN